MIVAFSIFCTATTISSASIVSFLQQSVETFRILRVKRQTLRDPTSDLTWLKTQVLKKSCFFLGGGDREGITSSPKCSPPRYFTGLRCAPTLRR